MSATAAISKDTTGTIAELDASDPLGAMRQQFRLPEGVVYLDGNSLGALPAATPERLRQTVETEWGQGLISSWNNHGWMDAAKRIGSKIAPIIGAAANEVIVTDSTSINLFKLMVAALKHQPQRHTILSEPGNFPTDLYIAQGVADLVPGSHLRTVPAQDLIAAIDEDTAVVVLTHVHYKSGCKLDMAALTAAAHAKGALILWDLSHSAGAVELDLNGCGVDLAVGCGYKYFNGGVGAPAFLFVAERLQAALRSPLSGWIGHAAPFDFGDNYHPAPGIHRFLCGTPPVLAMAALEVGIDLMRQVSMRSIEEKSKALSSLFIHLLEERCADHGFELITPRDPDARGSHVSISHAEAYPICQALIARGVVGDFRAPDALRFGFTPLYTSYRDVWDAIEGLDQVMRTRAWDREIYRVRARVT